MAVQLGAKPEHSFDEPLGLLSDCHRRIEKFLDVMIRVLERSGRDPAVSSSVVVTFMTDFFGFLALLGIAAVVLL